MRSSRFLCSSASSSKAGTIPACKVTRFRSAPSHVSLEKHKAARRIAPLKVGPSAPPRGEEHCRRREELCVLKVGRHMEAIEQAYAFRAAVGTVGRQVLAAVERQLDYFKVCREINGFVET